METFFELAGVLLPSQAKKNLVIGMEARQRLFAGLQIHVDDNAAFNASHHAIDVILRVADVHPAIVVLVTRLRNGLPDDCLCSLLSISLNIICVIMIVSDGLVLFVLQ